MKKFALSTLICAALAAGAVSAHASGLGDALRGQLGGGGAAESSGSRAWAACWAVVRVACRPWAWAA